MNIDSVIAVLESPSEAAIDDLLQDEETVFWVDWRQDDDSIPDACEAVLQTGKLAGKLVEVDTDQGYEVWIRYGDRFVQVPLTYTAGDRHITLCSLNETLRPDYEVRFCIDSHGSDAAAFLPLAAHQWRDLEHKYGDAVAKHFYKFKDRPNLFTHPISL
jgi:hypothetical protein